MEKSINRPLPRILPEAERFWRSAAAGVLELQFCLNCQQYIYYPRVRCPHCLSNTLEWRPTSGKGRIHSFTIARRPTHPALASQVPYVIAIVELAEGPRMTCLIRGCDPEDVHIDMPVRTSFLPVREDLALVDFEPDR